MQDLNKSFVFNFIMISLIVLFGFFLMYKAGAELTCQIAGSTIEGEITSAQYSNHGAYTIRYDYNYGEKSYSSQSFKMFTSWPYKVGEKVKLHRIGLFDEKACIRFAFGQFAIYCLWTLIAFVLAGSFVVKYQAAKDD